jgi:hypothetical protein
MATLNCIPPTCEYSIAREKCIKPNPYIEYKSYCSRNGISLSDCTSQYNSNKINITKDACKYHKERITTIKPILPKKKPVIKKQPIINNDIIPKKRGRPRKNPIIDNVNKKDDIELNRILKIKQQIIDILKQTYSSSNKSSSPNSFKTASTPNSFKTASTPNSFKTASSPNSFKTASTPNSFKTASTSKLLNISSSSNSNSNTLSSSTLFNSNSSNSSKSSKSSLNQELDAIQNRLTTIISNINKYKYLSDEQQEELVSAASRLTDIEEAEEAEKQIKLENAQKIKDFILPLITRVAANIKLRIKYYNIVSKYIKSREKYENNCLKFYKLNTDNTTFRIGNRIILDKKIGSSSKYGSVYLSHYRHQTNRKFGHLIKFATKIIDLNKIRNQIEYSILEDLTIVVISEGCPHFPITFGKLTCTDNNAATSKYSSDPDNSFYKYKSSNSTHTNPIEYYLPDNINSLTNSLFIFSELANGDYKQFYRIYYENTKFILNAFVQIILSLMFFYKYINAFHNDAHYGNFLYHKIKPGGYFHYTIDGQDYYLENIGFLWVIWDFGLITPFTNSKSINNNKYGEYYENRSNKFGDNRVSNSIVRDYIRIIKTGFINTHDGGKISNVYQFPNDVNDTITYIFNFIKNYRYINDITKLSSVNRRLLNILAKMIDTFTTTKPTTIINQNPFNL